MENPADTRKNSKVKQISYYAVVKGRQPGIYTTSQEALEQTNNFKRNLYRKFKSQEEAETWMSLGYVEPPAPGTVGKSEKYKSKVSARIKALQNDFQSLIHRLNAIRDISLTVANSADKSEHSQPGQSAADTLD